MGRVGGREPFEQGREDLEALAGVVTPTKQVERVSEELGAGVESFWKQERGAILSGKPAVFTQTRKDEKGFPLRDEDSTTYVGAIETAEEFGPRIYAEAVRRGLRQAHK